MSIRILRPAVLLVSAAFALVATGAVPANALKKHPSIPDPKTSKCATCHEEVTRVRVPHAAIESGCLSCHEFFRSETSGWAVRLLEPVPGLCVTCHDGYARAAAGKLKAPHAPALDCTSCHSPHGSDLPNLLVSKPPQLCLSCHTVEEVNKAHKVPVSRANCAGCHDPHGSDVGKMFSGDVLHAPFLDSSCSGCHRSGVGMRALVKGNGASLCYACHADLEEKFKAPGTSPHGAVSKGRCTGCHDPHLAGNRALLKSTGPALCFPCHVEVKARVTAKGAHRPAASDCSTCHEPHVASRKFLLRSAVPGLCLSCHPLTEKKAKGRGSASLGPSVMVRRHLGADLAKVDCAGCHDPHGSGRPHLFSPGSVHAPFQAGCASCHVPGKGTALAGKSIRALCVTCHADVGEKAKVSKEPHAAMEGDCTDCHAPHASQRPRLLKGRGGEPCTGCHEAQATAAGHVSHGIIDLVGCQSCHLSHGGGKPKLLRATGNELCNGCHLDGAARPDASGAVSLPGGFILDPPTATLLRRVSLDGTQSKNHPLPGHPVAGVAKQTNPRGALSKNVLGQEITCLSCHAPHSAPTATLFSGDATGPAELCQRCHEK